MFAMEIVRLIERCRQGDAEALGELYEAYAHRMRGVCRRYISDKQMVEDVVHDAFVIIFTSFDRLRDPRRAEAWMMAIVRNVASKCKDHLDTLPTIPLEETNGADLLAAEDGGVCMSSEEKDVRGVPLSEVIRMIDKLPEGYGQRHDTQGNRHRVGHRATFIIIATDKGKKDVAQDDAAILGLALAAIYSPCILSVQENV